MSSTETLTDSIASSALLVREASGQYRPASAEEVIRQARAALAKKVRRGATMTNPSFVKDYLRVTLAPLEHEVFGIIFLDAQHRIIEVKEMFRGTLSQTSVYPREVLKAALACNAGALLLFHNHPSGQCEASRADELLTSSLKSTLGLIDVRVLDHFIVAGDQILSFAERGLL